MISFSRAFDNRDIGQRSELLLQVLSMLIPCSTDRNKIQDYVLFSLFPVVLARVLVNVPNFAEKQTVSELTRFFS